MKRFYILSLCGLLWAGGCIAGGTSKSEAEGEPLRLADPCILLHEGKYYAYGTGHDDGIEVFYSDTLTVWKRHTELALHKDNSYGEKWFWAPEVYLNPGDGNFYMYYSAEEHLCVAVAQSPLGPFVQSDKQPMLQGKAIDSSLFVDTDGTPYLYFVRFTDGNVIWSAELERDWTTLKPETMRRCITAGQEWELSMGKVAEGPSVLEKGGTFYMVYSANHYKSPDYGVGFATSASPSGEWIKSPSNPILVSPQNRLSGTGHGAVFTDKQGGLKYVFHSHYNMDEIHPRILHIADMHIRDGEILIDENSIITPVALW